MMRAVWTVCVACVLACGAAVAGPVSGDPAPEGEIAIQVSPGTIALESATVWLTVHADVAYSAVADVAVFVNGTEVPVEYTKADSLDDLVVKVRIGAVKDIVEDAKFADVVLAVETADGDFTGSDTVKVTGGGRK